MGIRAKLQMVACTLGTSELAARGERWRALAPAAAKVELIDSGLRIVFNPEAGVEAEVRELAVLETECCSFADWRVHADDSGVTLDVTATASDAVAAVQGMFGTVREAVAEAESELTRRL